jgi:hypothetical protein
LKGEEEETPNRDEVEPLKFKGWESHCLLRS